MRRSCKNTRLAALLLAMLLAAGCLSGCDKKDPAAPEDGTAGYQTGTMDDFEEAPEGFVDNTVDPADYTEAELYFTDPEKNAIIGVTDRQAYYGGVGSQSRFAVNMISSGTGDVAGLSAAAIRDRTDYVQFGDIKYGLDDLVRPRTEGFAVLEMMAADFGVDIYAADENGTVYLDRCAGKDLSGEELREAYSERADFEDYTVCVYYLHAHMNGMDQASYDECRSILEEKYGIAHSSVLDGSLAVMLYYDTTGHDLFYAVAASAPDYWTDAEDFEANMNAHVRHDITKCCMVMDGDHPVGFVNQVFIRCDQDEPFPTDHAEEAETGGPDEAEPSGEE